MFSWKKPQVSGRPDHSDDLVIAYRYATREQALVVLRAMLGQLVFTSRTLKNRLHYPHNGNYRGPTTAAQDQRELALTKRKLQLINVMLACGRGHLVGKWRQDYQHRLASRMAGYNHPAGTTHEDDRRWAMACQADWVECHKDFDASYGVSVLSGGNMPGFRGWGAEWWFQLQRSLAHTWPKDIPYAHHGEHPMLVNEAWEALVGLPDPQAREAAFRLVGRQRDYRGRPVVNPWK